VERAVAATVAAGGTVWVGDETTLREFPPLRAAWARRGDQATVVISGRNGRRVLFGAVNLATAERVELVRERHQGADSAAFVAALGAKRMAVGDPTPWLLIWDNAPAHKPKPVQQALAEAGITVAWLPFRSPELNPCEDLWRHLKRLIAANRVYPTVDELADRAVAWLTGLTAEQTQRLAGLRSSKFSWLAT
jgi:transposase